MFDNVDKSDFRSLEGRIPGPKFPASGQRRKWGQTVKDGGERLVKTNWEIRLCLDLNQRVSVIGLIRPPDSYRWDSKEQLSCLLFFISNMEMKVPGWECALQPVMLWLMLFQRLLQHESREKISRMSGSLHSVLCFRCAENRANPPR